MCFGAFPEGYIKADGVIAFECHMRWLPVNPSSLLWCKHPKKGRQPISAWTRCLEIVSSAGYRAYPLFFPFHHNESTISISRQSAPGAPVLEVTWIGGLYLKAWTLILCATREDMELILVSKGRKLSTDDHVRVTNQKQSRLHLYSK